MSWMIKEADVDMDKDTPASKGKGKGRRKQRNETIGDMDNLAKEASGDKEGEEQKDKDDTKDKPTGRKKKRKVATKGEKRKAAAAAEEEEEDDEDMLAYGFSQMKFNKNVAKGMLMQTYLVRMLVATAWETYVLMAEAPLVLSLRARARLYSVSCRQQGKGHTNGPPHFHLFITMIEELSKLPIAAEGVVGTTQELMDKMKMLWDTVKPMEQEDLHYMIRHMQISKMYDKKTVKLHIGFAPGIESTVARSVGRTLLTIGAIHKLGGAPPGYIEHDMQRMLDSLEES